MNMDEVDDDVFTETGVLESTNVTDGVPVTDETQVKDLDGEGEVEGGFGEGEIMVEVVGSDVYVDGVGGDQNGDIGGDEREMGELELQEGGDLGGQAWDGVIEARVESFQEIVGFSGDMAVEIVLEKIEVIVNEDIVTEEVNIVEGLEKGEKLAEGGDISGISTTPLAPEAGVVHDEAVNCGTEVVVGDSLVVTGSSSQETKVIEEKATVFVREEAIEGTVESVEELGPNLMTSDIGVSGDEVWNPGIEAGLITSSLIAQVSAVVKEEGVDCKDEVLHSKVMEVKSPCLEKDQSTSTEMAHVELVADATCANAECSDQQTEVAGGSGRSEATDGKVIHSDQAVLSREKEADPESSRKQIQVVNDSEITVSDSVLANFLAEAPTTEKDSILAHSIDDISKSEVPPSTEQECSNGQSQSQGGNREEVTDMKSEVLNSEVEQPLGSEIGVAEIEEALASEFDAFSNDVSFSWEDPHTTAVGSSGNDDVMMLDADLSGDHGGTEILPKSLVPECDEINDDKQKAVVQQAEALVQQAEILARQAGTLVHRVEGVEVQDQAMGIEQSKVTDEKIPEQMSPEPGIHQEAGRRYGVDESTGVSCFKPEKMVENIRSLALFPSGGGDQLELGIAKAQLSALSRYKVQRPLPEFQLSGGFLENDANTPELSGVIERHSEKITGENNSSNKRKHDLTASLNSRKKERIVSELTDYVPHSSDGEDESTGRERKAFDSVTKVSSTTSSIPKQSFKVGECISRIASQLTGSPSPVKCNNEKFLNVDDRVDQPDAGCDLSLQTPVSSQRGKMILSPEHSSVDEMLSQLHLAAQHPMKGYSSLNSIATFFSGFRSSVVLGQNSRKQNSSMGRGCRKKKVPNAIANAPEEYEFDDVSDSYWTDRIVQNHAEEQRQHNAQNGDGSDHHQLMACKPDKQDKSDKPPKSGRKSRKRFSTRDHVPEAGVPADHTDGRSQDCLRTGLTLNFTEGKSVPSDFELNKIFRRFGPLKESETEVDSQTSCARVVFKRASDAEVAFSSAGKFNIFGSRLVNYELSYVPSAPLKTLPLATTVKAQEDAT